jgi:hypothetical protein
MMIGAVDKGDVDVRAGQRARDTQSAEPSTDHHDAVPLGAHATEASSRPAVRPGSFRPAAPRMIA